MLDILQMGWQANGTSKIPAIREGESTPHRAFGHFEHLGRAGCHLKSTDFGQRALVEDMAPSFLQPTNLEKTELAASDEKNASKQASSGCKAGPTTTSP